MIREEVLHITRAEAIKKILELDTEGIQDKKTLSQMTDKQLTLELNGRTKVIGEHCYRIRKHEVNIETFFKYLMQLTKSDDYRDVFDRINTWGENADFTYRGHILTSRRKFLKAFVISRFYAVHPCASIEELETELCYELSVGEKKELNTWFTRLGV